MAEDGKGARTVKTRVKTARGRKVSSTIWLERQLNDPYVQRAKREGFRSRAAFKLSELDDKRRFLVPGARVVDLGCAPGGWLQVAVKRVNALGHQGGKPVGRVLGVDINPVEPVRGAEILLLDFLAPEADATVKAALGGQADVVLSDMAAPSSGHRQTDHIRIIALCEAAAHFAFDVLAPGGAFAAKVLQGGAENDLLTLLKRRFTSVAHVKPPASRKDSAEMFVVATGFRAAAASGAAGGPGPDDPETHGPVGDGQDSGAPAG